MNELMAAIQALHTAILQLAQVANLRGGSPSPVAQAANLVTMGVQTDAAHGEQALPANPQRTYLLVQNNSTANLYVGIGGEPSPNGFGAIVLGPGNFYEPQTVPTNSIYLRSASLPKALATVAYANR